MVNPVYDHVIAMLVVGALFTGCVIAMPTVSLTNFEAVDQQQLRNTALNVFNAMLLDTGQPTNWGSLNAFVVNDPRVERFGLASGGESAFYVLDPDKVQRLVSTNPLNHCEYNRVRELLQLEEYGFRLRILPPFNVTNVDGTPIPLESPITMNGTNTSFEVKVAYLDGTPIPNAVVYGTIIYTADENFAITPTFPVRTDALGKCATDATLTFEPTHVLVVLRVTVADVATLVVTFGTPPSNDIANINFVGDHIILTMPDGNPRGARWIDNIVPITAEGFEFLYNGTRRSEDKLNYGALTVWDKQFNGLRQRNPVIFVFNFWAVEEGKGRQEVLVAGPCQNVLGFTVFEYGGKPTSSSVSLQRSVRISDMTYIAQLLLWKD